MKNVRQEQAQDEVASQATDMTPRSLSPFPRNSLRTSFNMNTYLGPRVEIRFIFLVNLLTSAACAARRGRDVVAQDRGLLTLWSIVYIGIYLYFQGAF